jgi:hypothetical protein
MLDKERHPVAQILYILLTEAMRGSGGARPLDCKIRPMEYAVYVVGFTMEYAAKSAYTNHGFAKAMVSKTR